MTMRHAYVQAEGQEKGKQWIAAAQAAGGAAA